MSESDPTNLPQPNLPQPNLPQQKNLNPTIDEWIAIILAIATMGMIFFWVLGKVQPKSTFSLLSSQPETVSENTSSINISNIVREASPPRTSAVSEPVVPVPESKPQRSPRFSGESIGLTMDWLNLKNLQGLQRLLERNESTSSATVTTPVPSQPLTTDTETTDTPSSSATVTTPVPSQPLTTDTETTDTPSPSEVAETPDANSILLANVPEDHWARDFITYFVDQNQAVGSEDGTFTPDEPISRGQFANQLQKSLETEEIQPPGIIFEDIPQDYWANPAIEDTTKMGFLSGYPGEVFRPEQEMTRVEVVVALVSGLNLSTSNNPQQILEVYSDAEEIPDWAADKIATATEAGLVASYPDSNVFNPSQSVSQAEAMVMIYQALVVSDKAEPITSEYIVSP